MNIIAYGFVRLSLFMCIYAAAASVLVTGLAAGRPTQSAFEDYSDLLGDTALEAALARGFTCQPSGRCIQRSPDKILLWTSGAQELTFSLQENALTLGDAAALWGEPDIWWYCETAVAAWPSHQIMSLVAPTDRLSYFSPLLTVSFTRGSPRWQKQLLNDTLHSCGGIEKDT